MKLDRVTITGADGVAVKELAALTHEFPFVEWGILVSRNNEYAPRFPVWLWVVDLLNELPIHAQFSLHVCGQWVKEICQGETPFCFRREGFDRFQRIQLNFHGNQHTMNVDKCVDLLDSLHDCQIILQMDGVNEGLYNLLKDQLNVVPLYDHSGGAGKIPTRWPRPLIGVPYCGYAGGLGPETVQAELIRIGKVAGMRRIWIDMEKNVRTHYEEFDLARVRKVLEICAPMVGREFSMDD